MASLDKREAASLLKELSGWRINTLGRLEKSYGFKDFSSALAFANRLGVLAEEQDHHPDIRLGWGRAVVELWTHQADGLTENDFIFAAKADRLL